MSNQRYDDLAELLGYDPKWAAAQLDAIDASDPERAHGEADKIILHNCDPRIAAAYKRLMDRCAWWSTA